jgi:hypothetical protein
MLSKCTASTVENFHTCQIGKMILLGVLKIYALKNTRSTCYVSSIGLRNLMIPRQLPVLHRPFTFADTPIGQSLLKLDESQRKRLESLFNTAYGVVKAGKPFSDYELICEIQVKNGLDLGENYRNINGCKTFAASIAQTLVDKQVKFQILSYKLGLGKSLTGLGLKKFKKPWAWACPKEFSTPEYYLQYSQRHSVINHCVILSTVLVQSET